MQSLIDLIQLHLIPALLVIVRLGGIMVFAPMFGSSIIPLRIKVFFSFLVGLAVYPMVPTPDMPPWEESLSLWAVAPLVGLELVLGATIGFLASLPLVAAETGGLIMGQQMGLSFARFFNPAMDSESDVIGQAFFLVTLGGFILVGGHEQIILCVLHSFDSIPLGTFVVEPDIVDIASGLLLAAFEFALRIAAPLLALIFLETVAMGFVAKTVPQLNILSLGFPIRIMAGFFIIIVGLVAINEVMMEGIDELMLEIHRWIEMRP